MIVEFDTVQSQLTAVFSKA